MGKFDECRPTDGNDKKYWPVIFSSPCSQYGITIQNKGRKYVCLQEYESVFLMIAEIFL